jgi:glyoxylase-like metal-dependent hydrolase (beta-lactamase superfamily II)
MRTRYAEEITQGFWFVGPKGVPVYLLDGPIAALFDSGFAALAPLYEEGIKSILGHRCPSFLFLTHAHWDHLGAAGYFKDLWPDMTIAGPPGIQDILDRPKAIEAIENLNRQGARDLKRWDESMNYDTPFKPFSLDLTVGPFQRINLDCNGPVQAIPTPGHTREHTSYWLPERRILVASEAVGSEEAGRLIPEFVVDFDAYRTSMEALINLDPGVLCLAHQMSYKEGDAVPYMKRALAAAEAFAARVECLLRETGGDVEETVNRVKALQWEDLPYPKQPESAYLINTEARVRHLWHRMKRRERGNPDKGSFSQR